MDTSVILGPKSGLQFSRPSTLKSPQTKKYLNQLSLKVSPFFSENIKVQKLAESKEGQQALELIQEVISFYKMDNSLTIFNSESNCKTEPKRDEIARKNNIEAKTDEPVLYSIFAKFIEKNKAAAPALKEKKVEKPV